ncbi:MAG: 30S ribosomal protein S20 [Rhodospirillales bacterium]
MANHKSAEKRARQTKKRTAINVSRRSRLRGAVKKVEATITSGDGEAARKALQTAQLDLARGVSKGVMHKNTAARKMSRMSKRVKALGAKKS